EDVFLHLGIPALRLVPEVNACFEQLLHGDVSQTTSLVDCILRGTSSPLGIDSLRPLPSEREGRFLVPVGPFAGTRNLTPANLKQTSQKMRTTLVVLKTLAFAELEAFTSAFLSVLLALLAASIAREEAFDLEFLAQFNVELQQGAGDAHLERASLAVDAATGHVRADVKCGTGLAGHQRLPNFHSL